MGQLCFGKSACLSKFVLKVFLLEYSEKPDYAELQRILGEALISNEPEDSIESDE